MIRWASFSVLVILLAGCGATVSSRERLERWRTPGKSEWRETLGEKSKDPSTAARDLEIWAGRDSARLAVASGMILRLRAKDPGFSLMAARLAWESLQMSGVRPGRWQKEARDAMEAYANAAAAFLGGESEAVARGGVLTVETPAGPVSVAVRFPKSGPLRAEYFDDFLVARGMVIRGFRERVVEPGLGVALVGLRERKPGREHEMANHPRRGIAMPVSGVIEFTPGRASVQVVDPVRTSSVRIGGNAVPVAADFTAPLALSFGGANDLLLGLRNLLNVPAGSENAGIYLGEPLDPNRIPVLLIHGLSSTPIVWRNLASVAMADPIVRRNFQFWYAFYPTGAPVVLSASKVRTEIEELRAQAGRGSPAARRLDLVGYSMGGNIARILASDIGDRLWREVSRVPFDDVKLSPDDREVVRRAVFWRPVPGVQTVIFVATPHRGTRMADASFARWAARLVQLPGDLLGLQARLFEALGDAFNSDIGVPSRVTGIGTLSARSPLYQAWEGLPLEKGARFYSIIGDRGRGDTPNSSDGIVGYWSSHLEGAESELIVPTGHDAQAYPGTEQKILRVLRNSLGPDRRAGQDGNSP